MKKIFIVISVFLLLVTISWAEESSLSITNMKVEPAAVVPSSKVLISCQVSHTEGPMFIEVVAATIFHGDWVTSYPMLYDDGTNGDEVADDGVYSLEITAGETIGEHDIVFHAVDTDKNEIESEPIILNVG